MKGIKKAKFFAVFLLIISVFFSMGIIASAAQVRIMPETLWAGSQVFPPVRMENFPMSAKVISITSNRPRVIKAHKTGDGESNNYLEALKEGKSVITVKYKDGKKTKSVKAKYTVKKYPSPFKSITFNGKKINLKQYPYSTFRLNYKKSVGIVKVTPNKGWKITYMSGTIYDKNYNMEKEIQVKNNRKFAVAKNKVTHVWFVAENTKGETLDYYIDIQRFKG